MLGAAAAVALAGCAAPGGPSTPGPGAGADDAGPDGDLTIAREAADLAVGLRALVAATVGEHPGLRDDLADLRAAHAAHATALDVAPDSATPSESPAPAATVPGRPGPARAAVVRREQEAVAAYAGLAGRAESGRLARVLASASAGLAQALVGLVGADEALAAATGAAGSVPLPPDGLSGSATEALQTTLAAEHAAVWTLAVVGARTSGSQAPELLDAVRTSYGTHRDRRDALTAALRGAGSEPTPAAASYATPDLGEGPDGRRAAARRVEEACATTYASLAGSTTAERRAWATAALTDAAVRALGLGGPATPLPGL